jgi:beta-N-acetylglucosaminidase
MKKTALLLLLGIGHCTLAQNLPSLLTGKNVYSTFSITAYDSAAQEWGIADVSNRRYQNEKLYLWVDGAL